LTGRWAIMTVQIWRTV